MEKTKLISFLGTSQYVPCSYYFENPDEEFFVTTYVQNSILRRLVLDKKLGKEDEFVILMTEAAKQKNWDGERGNGERETLKDSLENLKEELERGGMEFPDVRSVLIPEGKSEDELWKIFGILVGQINEGDQIYLDITHSFRSLPALVLVAMNYLRVVKHAALQGIYYGAFEVLGVPREVQKMPLNERQAPIFELTAFADLFEWTSAANQFINTGNALRLAKLARQEVRPILRKGGPQKGKANLIEKLGKSLEKFSRDLFTVHGPHLPKDAVQVKKDLGEAREDAKEIPGLMPLMDVLVKEFEEIEDSADFIEKTNFLVDYCFRHELIQQGFTLLDENVTTLACKILNVDFQNKDWRQVANSAMAIVKDRKEESDWYYPAKNIEEDQQKMLYRRAKDLEDKLTDLIEIKRRIGDYRNMLNHAGFNNSTTNYDRFLEKGKQFLDDFKMVCQSYGIE